jgi:ABC-type molybdate transport system substrate-binding protein
VGLGDPTSVAVGVATERWMKAELDPEARRAIEANVRTRALNVNELGSQLTLGALDAAVVWDVTIPLFEALESVAPASALPHRTVITGGVLGLSRQPEIASSFLAFLSGPDGAAIFAAHGYEPCAR